MENGFVEDKKNRGAIVRLCIFIAKSWEWVFVKGFYEILKQDDNPTISMLAVIVLVLQISSIPFSDALVVFWKFDWITQYLNYAHRILNITPAISNFGFVSHATACVVPVVFLVMLLIELALFSSKRRRTNFSGNFIVKLVRLHMHLVLNVLSLPFRLLFTTIFDCKTVETYQRVMQIATGTECFSGTHILVCCVSVLGQVIHTMTGTMACLWFYETSYLKDHPLSQKPSFSNLLVLAYQIYFAFARLTVKQENMVYLLLGGLIIFNLITAVTGSLSDNFFDPKVRNLCTASSLCYLWSNFMLLIAHMFEGDGVSGSFAIWAFIYPLIMFKFMSLPMNMLPLLLINVDKSQSADGILEQLIFLMQLSRKYSS